MLIGGVWILSRQEFLLSDFWTARKIFAGVNLGQIWSITLSAAAWTLWLVRNELVFEQNQLNIELMNFLLKISSYKWCLAWGGLSSDIMELWSVNPIGALLLSCKRSK